MEIGASNPSVLAQAAVENRQLQTPAPPPRENVALETAPADTGTSQPSSGSNERVGGQIDTFA